MIVEKRQPKGTNAEGLCILLLFLFKRYFKRNLSELNNLVTSIAFTISPVLKLQFVLFCERSKKPRQPFLPFPLKILQKLDFVFQLYVDQYC